MELRDIKNMSTQMIRVFVDSIGLDGKYYAGTCNSPMFWGIPKFGNEGEFVTPGTPRLNRLLSQLKLDDKSKKIISSRGFILVNSNYRTQKVDMNLFVTVIHEMIHSNRNLMIYDATRNEKNEKAYNYEEGRFIQNTFDFDFSYVDASQDLIKGNIDNNKDDVDILNSKTTKELDDMEFASGKINEQMSNQQIIDEALVELMSILSYLLYKDFENGINPDVWKYIEDASHKYEGSDIGYICEIILRHQDFELFYWMIDPITYSFENIHYDFFKDYTKNDQDLLKMLYTSDEINMDSMSEFKNGPIR